MTTGITSAPFSMEISSRIFLLFNRGAVNLIVRHLSADIRRFRQLGGQRLGIRTQFVSRQFLVTVSRRTTRLRLGSTLALFRRGS